MSEPGASAVAMRQRLPAAARYCHRCGHDRLDHGHRRRVGRAASYVAAPTQRVRSVNVVTALLPLSSGDRGARLRGGARRRRRRPDRRRCARLGVVRPRRRRPRRPGRVHDLPLRRQRVGRRAGPRRARLPRRLRPSRRAAMWALRRLLLDAGDTAGFGGGIGRRAASSSSVSSPRSWPSPSGSSARCGWRAGRGSTT